MDAHKEATGRLPFIDPVPLAHWRWTVEQGSEAYQEQRRRTEEASKPMRGAA